MTHHTAVTAPLSATPDGHAREIAQGERFQFGDNWTHFLAVLDEPRIAAAEQALQTMLEMERLDGLSFLDIGSGSGLSSLAARRLGARVTSFDYDPQSVACTRELARRYFPDDPSWTIQRRSVLDREALAALGTFDIVYSWGVLHHTGHLWDALQNAIVPVKPRGRLFIAIYNDTGTQSRRWRQIKRIYNGLPRLARPPFAMAVTLPGETKRFLGALLRGRPGEYVRTWTEYKRRRGMSMWYDIVDWVGGYPYEFATPDQIFDFYRARGFSLRRIRCGGVGLGCNEFIFERARQE